MTEARSRVRPTQPTKLGARSRPAAGTRRRSTRRVGLSAATSLRAAELLARGTGPFAVDAERASGFRYSNRAYLVQIRRAGAGTVLIDPVSHGGDPLAGAWHRWPTCWPPTSGCCTPPIRTCRAWPRSGCGRRRSTTPNWPAGWPASIGSTWPRWCSGCSVWAGQGARRRRLVQAPTAGGLAQLRRAGRRGAPGAARRGRRRAGGTGQSRLGGTGIRAPAHLRSRTRPGATGGAARRGSTRCATRGRWPRCASCGRRATRSPGAATSRRAASCPTRRSSTPRTVDPETVDKLDRPAGVRRIQATAQRAGVAGRAGPGPCRTRTRPTLRNRPTGRRRRRGGPAQAGGRRTARGRPQPVWPNSSRTVSVPTENLCRPTLVRRLCWDWEPAERHRGRRRANSCVGAAARPWQRELTVPVLTAALTTSPDASSD